MALELYEKKYGIRQNCLNPCSNGMALEQFLLWLAGALICLNPCSNGMALELLIITFN